MARSKKFKFTEAAQQVAGLGAGAVLSNKLASFVPVENTKIQAAAPIVLGVILSGKKGILGHVGAGMVAGGASQLATEFGITGLIPERLAGVGTVTVDDAYYSPTVEDRMAGTGEEMNY